MLLTDTTQLTQTPTRKRTVVIGSGAVGLYTARQLAHRGQEVVLIEAGTQHLGNFDTESFRSIGFPNEGIKIGRSRTLGGTTNLWGGQLVEFQPIDFKGRDWLPGSKWPVTYEELAAYYPATYENLGLDRPTHTDDAVWQSVSMQKPALGADLEAFFTRWIKIPNFARYYQADIESNPNLLVLTNHTAVGFTGDGETIKSVKIADSRGNVRQIHGDTFVLAAGTIETCRLLLHSAADTSWSCPWRTNTNVGAYFHDHLGTVVATVHPFDTSRFFTIFSTIARLNSRFQPKIRFQNTYLEQHNQLNIQGMFGFEGSASEHLIYLKQFIRAAIYSRQIMNVRDMIASVVGSIRHLPPLMWRYVWQHRIFVPSTSKIALHIQMEQMPVRESRITIDASHLDAAGLPRVILDWKLGGEELASIREFAIRADQSFQAANLAKLKINEDLLASNPRFLTTCHDTYHQSGGTIMGTSAADGVVDKNLRVFNTNNLYIGGASTFRTVSNANTTFTAITFATRLVDHLCK